MIPTGILVYFIPLVLAALYALYKSCKETTIIVFVLILSFFGTRIISGNVDGSPYMWDMLNDLSVMVILLFWLGKDNILVKMLAATYGAMTLGCYIPLAFGLVSQNTAYIILEVIGLFHILIVVGGSTDGYTDRFVGGVQGLRDGGRGSVPARIRDDNGSRVTFDKNGTGTFQG